MTQRRRVRALHLASCCTLHTYSIGCTASQRNNIVTIHHTSAVNKTSGSFCHPRSSSPATLILSPSCSSFFHPLLLFYYLFLLHSRSFLCVSASLWRSFSLPDSHSNHVFATSAYLFDFFFPPILPIAHPLPIPSPFFARLIFSPLAQPTNHPPTRIFFLSAFPPRSTSIRFPLCAVRPPPSPSHSLSLSLSLSLARALVSRVYAGVEKKHPRHEPRRLTFCAFVGHRRY